MVRIGAKSKDQTGRNWGQDTRLRAWFTHTERLARPFLWIFFLLPLLGTPSLGQDSTRVHSPDLALRRALLMPGSGQFYNRQPVKAAVVYGALGTFVGLVVLNEREYRHFQRVYRFAATPERFPQYAAEAETYSRLIQGGRIEPLRSARNLHRRNRDLSVLGFGLGYALSVLDAYVSAHLLDFELVEGLDFTPAFSRDGAGARITVALP